MRLTVCLHLQLYQEAGVHGQAFMGVPVFQAEGLTVKTDKKRYTPLFFSKEDLDAAVGNAYTTKEQHRDVTNKAHSARADADLAAAQNKVCCYPPGGFRHLFGFTSVGRGLHCCPSLLFSRC